MKNFKTQLAVLLLATLCLLTVAYGQVIPRRDMATRSKAKPVQSQSAKSGPMVQEQETVLYSFTGMADGATPGGGLIRDGEGNLYGIASAAGDLSCFCGVVFKLDRMGNETVLHTFTGPPDGGESFSNASLVRDEEGNLYGTTTFGGSGSLAAGTVFKLEPPAQPGG
ncbi:MAG: choice-of-anchor tandem repeat GloVer-containing protein, partial [Terriglobales bacterium]